LPGTEPSAWWLMEVDVIALESLGEALRMASAMGWEILWPLILGFALRGGPGRRTP